MNIDDLPFEEATWLVHAAGQAVMGLTMGLANYGAPVSEYPHPPFGPRPPSGPEVSGTTLEPWGCGLVDFVAPSDLWLGSSWMEGWSLAWLSGGVALKSFFPTDDLESSGAREYYRDNDARVVSLIHALVPRDLSRGLAEARRLLGKAAALIEAPRTLDHIVQVAEMIANREATFENLHSRLYGGACGALHPRFHLRCDRDPHRGQAHSNESLRADPTRDRYADWHGYGGLPLNRSTWKQDPAWREQEVVRNVEFIMAGGPGPVDPSNSGWKRVHDEIRRWQPANNGDN